MNKKTIDSQPLWGYEMKAKRQFKLLLKLAISLLFLGLVSFLFTERHYFIGLFLVWVVFELYIDISFILKNA